MVRSFLLVCILLISLGPGIAPANADEDAANFFRGKVVTLVVGEDANSEYMVSGRLLANYISKYIPGNPTVIVQAMPGASSVASMNYLYNVAPRDGTVFDLPNKSVATYEATKLTGIQYKSAEMNWIGSMTAANNVVVVMASSGVKTLDDAKQKQVVMGAQGIGGTLATYPLVLNHLVGTKFKLVLGYAGGSLINLAMDRGEVEGRGSYTWDDLKHSRRDWLTEHKVNILVQIGMRKEHDLPNVPLLSDLAHNDREREILDFISSDTLLGRPFVLPPGVPKNRVDALRTAFEQTMRDPNFLADAKRLQNNISPVSGLDLQRKVVATADAPAATVATAEKWMSP
jgi:tripartite-type tricarboxylate transporter receptor subunit TctC